MRASIGDEGGRARRDSTLLRDVSLRLCEPAIWSAGIHVTRHPVMPLNATRGFATLPAGSPAGRCLGGPRVECGAEWLASRGGSVAATPRSGRAPLGAGRSGTLADGPA